MSGLIESGVSVSLPEAKTDFDMSFLDALNVEQPTFADTISTITSSKGKTKKYPILSQMTGLREWIGPRVYEDVSRYAYALTNRLFEKGFEVDVDELDDDQLEGYSLVASQIGEQCRLWPEDLVLEAVQKGGNRLCFDGQFFFDVDHPVDPANPSSATYQNLFPSKPLSTSNFSAVLAAMQTIVGRDSRPMGFGRRENSLILLVPAQLREVGKQIVQAEYLASGATNVNRNAAQLVVWDRLYDPTDPASAARWYLLDVGHKLKPFLFQQRLAPQTTAMTAATDANVFETNKFRWGVKSRGAAGYTVPFLAARADA